MSTTTSISVPNNACNHQNLTLFDLSAFKLTEWIYVGQRNGKYVSTFIIDGLFLLRSLTIDKRSFTESNNNPEYNPSKSFHVTNCKELKTLDIDSLSLIDFSGEFELSKLPKLESVVIDGSTVSDLCFSYTNIHLHSNPLSQFVILRSS